MKNKTKILISSLFMLIFTACGDSVVYTPGIIYDGVGYYGNELSGRSFQGFSYELGIGSGDFYDLNPDAFHLYFNNFSTFVTGNKNCNAFQADPIWYDNAIELHLIYFDNFECIPYGLSFPEGLFIEDLFEIEVYFDFGQRVLVLYSYTQNVAYYLREI
jgi:hypothetical protein